MPAVDFVEMAIEESPVYEGANTAATPYRISTDKLYLPARSAVLRPGPQFLDRSDELRGVLGSPPRLIDGFQVAGSLSSAPIRRTSPGCCRWPGSRVCSPPAARSSPTPTRRRRRA